MKQTTNREEWNGTIFFRKNKIFLNEREYDVLSLYPTGK
jgi:hypothetical protein